MKKLWLKWFGLTVNVSAEDIEKGNAPRTLQTDRAETCAIAQALKRKFGTQDTAWGYSCGHADDLLFRVADKDALAVQNFVYAHDDRKPVQPFSFKIVV